MTLFKPAAGPDLLKRDGLYYARVQPSFSDGPMEIALHGVASEEQARAALNALVKPMEHRRLAERYHVGTPAREESREKTMLKRNTSGSID